MLIGGDKSEMQWIMWCDQDKPDVIHLETKKTPTEIAE